jgi:hypothetical protein
MFLKVMILARIILLCMMICAIVCSCDRTDVNKNKSTVSISRFQVGQIWTFNLPTNKPPTATLKVVRVDIDPEDGPIIFIHVTGAQSHTWDENIYCLSQDALNRSVISLVETNSTLTDGELKKTSDYYEMYQRGVQTHTFSKSSDMTVAEFLEHDAKN